MILVVSRYLGRYAEKPLRGVRVFLPLIGAV